MAGKIRGYAVIMNLEMATQKGFEMNKMVGLRETINAIFSFRGRKRYHLRREKFFKMFQGIMETGWYRKLTGSQDERNWGQILLLQYF